MSDPGFVYAVGITGQPGRYKIGKGANPDDRLRRFQTGHAETLYLARTWPTDNMHRDESRMHRLLRARNIRGEWFACDLDTIDNAWAQTQTAAGNPFVDAVHNGVPVEARHSPDPTFGRAARREPPSIKALNWVAFWAPWVLLAAAFAVMGVLVAATRPALLWVGGIFAVAAVACVRVILFAQTTRPKE